MDTQNSSQRNIFKAYDIRGKVGSELSDDLLNRVGTAFASWLSSEGPIVVGHDMRPDSKSLAAAFMTGVIGTGRNVINIGMVTSDMAVFAIKELGAAGAAIVTASHNPGEYNGIKLYDDTPKTIGLDQGLDSIRDTALGDPQPREVANPGTITTQDLTEPWVEFALSKINIPLIPSLHIAIDAGNGMAGVILPTVLKRLPQLTVQELYFNPDGTFPNHLANPQDLTTLQDLQATIKQSHLDLGIAFDGDGDRMAMVDETGTPISGSEMFSLLAEKYVSKDTKFVHEVRTSRVVITRIEQNTGAKAVRSKSGRSNIGEVMRDEGAVFGGETTGHFFFEEYWNNDSGLLAMLVALEQIGKSKVQPLSLLVNAHRTGAMIPETNFAVENADDTIAKIAKQFVDQPQDTLDGLSVNSEDWWFNIRKSNTEPLIRLNAEAKTPQILDEIVTQIKHLVNV